MSGLINYDQLALLLARFVPQVGLIRNRLIHPLTDLGIVLVAYYHTVSSRGRKKQPTSFLEAVTDHCHTRNYRVLGWQLVPGELWAMLVGVDEAAAPGDLTAVRTEEAAEDMKAAVFALLDKRSAAPRLRGEGAPAQAVASPATEDTPPPPTATEPSAV
jgi:hypothetical protein